ncbi:MAG: hypothetical protein U1F83_20335 [Verrucomicrobiota bacterium]
MSRPEVRSLVIVGLLLAMALLSAKAGFSAARWARFAGRDCFHDGTRRTDGPGAGRIV